LETVYLLNNGGLIGFFFHGNTETL
jgi:hypothetical protein